MGWENKNERGARVKERTLEDAQFVRKASVLGPLLRGCPCERCDAARQEKEERKRKYCSPLEKLPVFITLASGEYFAITGLSDAWGPHGDRACNLYNLGKLALEKHPREAKALFEECSKCVTMANSRSLSRPCEGKRRSIDEIPEYRNLRDYMIQLSMTELTDRHDEEV